MEDINWSNQLKPIMEKAGEILLFYWGKQLKENRKEAGGFVTQADLDSEKYLIEALGSLFPAAFWAEESGQSGLSKTGYRWVIDPLDGTSNFSRQIPYFCVSVALTYHDEPQIAAIYNPLSQQFFFAQKGKGAWRNGSRLRISNPTQFSDVFIALGIPYKKSERPEIIQVASQVGLEARSIRHLGAIALDMANVAAARFDGVFFSHLGWWDVAAGMLLVHEAGGCVSDFDGQPIKPAYLTCVAGGTLVYQRLVRIISQTLR